MLTLRPSDFLRRVNLLLHLALFSLCAVLLSEIWWWLLSLPLFATSALFADRHFALRSENGICGLGQHEGQWRMQNRAQQWLRLTLTAPSYVSQQLLVIAGTDEHGRHVRQLIARDMLNEADYRRLCRWLRQQPHSDASDEIED
ncbi:protein YgfX [Permianibacter aggregans]|uniref:Toxin CptA n=1 Tax=Permianibacter aggregans TaxID=1510150 RepID=A0A4R6UUR1_9GAMM|nr:protein YgfX [Permianibacter aggregans]QGX41268.1 hypothetical protein E2H98_16995 [Permianibacter aggregans]TDQ51050.1 hypothetical protein EV696_10119 [Permianibacter aggregans]